MIEALARPHRSGSDARLLICGDGPRRELLEHLVSWLGLGRYTAFFGWVSRGRLPELLGSVDLFVSRSRSASWRGAVAEAMASGVAVLSSGNVGARERICSAENGPAVDVGDVDGGERSRRVLPGDTSLREGRGAAGARGARANVQPKIAMGAWNALYQEELSDREPRDSKQLFAPTTEKQHDRVRHQCGARPVEPA